MSMDFVYRSLKNEIERSYKNWKGKSETYRDHWKKVHLELHRIYYPYWEDNLKEDIIKYRSKYLRLLESELDRHIME